MNFSAFVSLFCIYGIISIDSAVASPSQDYFIGEWSPLASCSPSPTCCCPNPNQPIIIQSAVSNDFENNSLNLSGQTSGGAGCHFLTVLTATFIINSTQPKQANYIVPLLNDTVSITLSPDNSVLTLSETQNLMTCTNPWTFTKLNQTPSLSPSPPTATPTPTPTPTPLPLYLTSTPYSNMITSTLPQTILTNTNTRSAPVSIYSYLSYSIFYNVSIFFHETNNHASIYFNIFSIIPQNGADPGGPLPKVDFLVIHFHSFNHPVLMNSILKSISISNRFGIMQSFECSDCLDFSSNQLDTYTYFFTYSIDGLAYNTQTFAFSPFQIQLIGSSLNYNNYNANNNSNSNNNNNDNNDSSNSYFSNNFVGTYVVVPAGCSSSPSCCCGVGNITIKALDAFTINLSGSLDSHASSCLGQSKTESSFIVASPTLSFVTIAGINITAKLINLDSNNIYQTLLFSNSLYPSNCITRATRISTQASRDHENSSSNPSWETASPIPKNVNATLYTGQWIASDDCVPSPVCCCAYGSSIISTSQNYSDALVIHTQLQGQQYACLRLDNIPLELIFYFVNASFAVANFTRFPQVEFWASLSKDFNQVTVYNNVHPLCPSFLNRIILDEGNNASILHIDAGGAQPLRLHSIMAKDTKTLRSTVNLAFQNIQILGSLFAITLVISLYEYGCTSRLDSFSG